MDKLSISLDDIIKCTSKVPDNDSDVDVESVDSSSTSASELVSSDSSESSISMVSTKSRRIKRVPAKPLKCNSSADSEDKQASDHHRERVHKQSNKRKQHFDLLEPENKRIKITIQNNYYEYDKSRAESNSLALESYLSGSDGWTVVDEWHVQSATSVKKSKPKTKTPERVCILRVSNLDLHVDGEMVEMLFACVGKVPYTKKRKDGVYEVAYEKYEDAMKSIKMLNNYKLNGQKIKVEMPTFPYRRYSARNEK